MDENDHELTRHEILLIREQIDTKMDERDRRYEERFKASEIAVSAALQAQEKLTNAAFAASKEAIGKAEIAQTAYNERSNEFRAALDDQARLLLSRTEADVRFKGWEERLELLNSRMGDLDRSRSEMVGKGQASNRFQEGIGVWVGIGLAGLALIVGLAGVAASFFKH